VVHTASFGTTEQRCRRRRRNTNQCREQRDSVAPRAKTYLTRGLSDRGDLRAALDRVAGIPQQAALPEGGAATGEKGESRQIVHKERADNSHGRLVRVFVS